MRKFTLIFSLLLAMVTTAMASDVVPSTSVDNPENIYTMVSGNNAKVGPNAVDGTAGRFAFFAVDGKEDTYYIYSVDAAKWFDYDLAASYPNKKGFVKMSDTQGNYFKITKCANNVRYYEIRPYNTTGVAGKYLNYFQGADGTNTLGLWQQNGDDDGGSRYLIEQYIHYEEVEPEALSTEYYYQIVNKAYGRALNDTGAANPGVTSSTAVSTSDDAQLWAIEITDGKYNLRNRGTGKYLAGNTNASSKWSMNAAAADLYIGVQQKGTTVAPTAYYYISATEIANPSNASRTCAHDANWHNGGIQVVTWDNTADGSQWAFVKTDIEIPVSYTVIYEFVYGSNVIASQTSTVDKGAAYPAINIQAPYGVTPVAADLAFMSGTVTQNETITINLEISKSLPFVTAASANEITTWYLVQMHTNQPGYIGDIADDKTVNVINGKSSDVANENYIWGFVGDVFSGVKVVNKGTGLELTSSGGGNVTLTENGTPFFVAETSETTENATNGFCLRKNDSDQYLNANYSAKKLSHWSSTDAGSTFFLTEYEEAAVTVSEAANWATMYLGYAVYVPEGVNVYTISGVENNYVVKEAVEGVIPANTGVLLENKGNYTFKKAANYTSAIENNLLDGSVVNTYVAGPAYVLSMPAGKNVGFYQAELNSDADGNEGTTHFLNNAGKAYLVLPEEVSNIAYYSFGYGEGTTGVEKVENADAEAVIYDLTGRRVQQMNAAGIYIVNGRKVLVK